MKGLIVINAYPNGEKFLRQSERIGAELRLRGVETTVLRNGQISFTVGATGALSLSTQEKYAFAVYLDKDKYLGAALERTGLRLFNSARAVELCDDKVTTYLALQEAGLRLAETVPAPLCYTPNANPDEDFLRRVAATLGFPTVVKKSYGSFGEGVRLARDFEELKSAAKAFLYQPHCYQKFVAESFGRDIRVIVIGGKAVAAMARVAQGGEFRSNIELGGIGKPIALSKPYAVAAERAAQKIGLDYCGVDLLETSDGPVLCEVNSNAFFEGLESATGFNVAGAYAEYIVQTVSKEK